MTAHRAPHFEHQQIMHYYTQIAEKSRAMLSAAQQADWDLLCQKEAESAELIARLRNSNATAVLNETERKQRLQILKKILADDAQIRQITEPWMDQLEAILQSGNNSRRLGAAYS